jgi:hypothetical protein
MHIDTFRQSPLRSAFKRRTPREDFAGKKLSRFGERQDGLRYK